MDSLVSNPNLVVALGVFIILRELLGFLSKVFLSRKTDNAESSRDIFSKSIQALQKELTDLRLEMTVLQGQIGLMNQRMNLAELSADKAAERAEKVLEKAALRAEHVLEKAEAAAEGAHTAAKQLKQSVDDSRSGG